MSIKQDILATLTYFDVFHYPLTQNEIAQFLKKTYCPEEFTDGLQELRMENWIHKFDGFYSLQDDYSIVQRRRNGNIKAKAMLNVAERLAGMLSSCPFVKGVAVSGSLSKNFADEYSGIEFFIIAEKNKLWLARTFMHGFRQIAILFKKQDWFCINYFIDEETLEIKEKNIYTATEIATLLPLRGIDTFNKFLKSNTWSKSLLPNHSLRISYVEETKNPFWKKSIEFLFRNPLGSFVEYFLMKLSSYRWNRKMKAGKMNKRGMVMRMVVSRHCVKPDPSALQKEFMESYERKISSLFYRYESRAKTVF